MKNNLLLKSRRIHFVGIGGCGMSALAGILANQKKTLTGSDKQYSSALKTLEKSGIKIFISHFAKNLPQTADLLIHSLAIPRTNPEIAKARSLKIPIMSYPAAIGELTKQFYTIAISGTHGKTTVTAMIAKTLKENNFDPNVIVGANLKELNGKNYAVGENKLLVLEACEYRRAFLNYSPNIAIIHTLDPDHLDYYKDFNDYLNAFFKFVRRVPKDGYIFVNLDDEDTHRIIQTLQYNKFPPYNIFTYSAKYSHSDFYFDGKNIVHKNSKSGTLNLKIPGGHNKTNALAAFACSRTLGIAPKNILKSLNNYTGASRRFETKGKIGKTIIIDDYGHHPEEIKATLSAAREKFPKAKICVVFQPHQYSRTKKLFKDFLSAFSLADKLIIPNIYESRDSEEDKKSVSPEFLAKAIRKKSPHLRAEYGNGLRKTIELLKKQARKYNIILTMGAGDVWKIADGLIKK